MYCRMVQDGGSYEGLAFVETRRGEGVILRIYLKSDLFSRYSRWAVITLGYDIRYTTKWSSTIMGSHDAPTHLPLVQVGRAGQ